MRRGDDKKVVIWWCTPRAAEPRPAQSLHQRPSGFATTAVFVPAKAFSSFLLRNTPAPQHACSATSTENNMAASVLKPLSLAPALVLAPAPPAPPHAAKPSPASRPLPHPRHH